MTTTLNIELPDNLIEQLGVSTESVEVPLQKMVLQSLQTLANLTRSLHDKDLKVRIQSVHKLGERGEEAISALRYALNDDDLTVQKSAVDALKKIGTEEALHALSKHPFVRVDEHTSDIIFDPLSVLVGSLKFDVSDLAENHDFYIAKELSTNV